ncbi:hypothetical protein GC163_09470 [bacterium]|nr:hypothetical protein [bacterium]
MTLNFRPWLLACLAGLSLCGCGQQTYQDRVKQTAAYYAYINKLNANVGAIWKGSPIEELRLPLQFREIPKPLPTKDPDTGKLVEAEIDPRQPDYVALKIPGLVATWEAPFRVQVDGAAAQRKGYLYLTTNAFMYANADDSRDAPDFVKNLLALIAEKFSLTPLDPATDLIRDNYPRSAPFYTPQKAYDVYHLPKTPTEMVVIDGVTYTIDVYVQHSGAIDVAMVAVLPVGLESSENLAERLPMMLSTMKISARPVLNPGGGGAAPPPSTGGF